MKMLKNGRALRIVSSAQITLSNVYDAYTINLSHSNFDIVCDDSGLALAGEIGVNGKAITTTSVLAGANKLTAVASNPTVGQYSITITAQKECTAAKSGNDKVYINTLLEGMSGKVSISFNLEGSTTIVKDITFIKKINKLATFIDGKFSFGTTYWSNSQNGTGELGSNIKVVKSKEAIYGSNLLEITNQAVIYSKQAVSIEEGRIYKCCFRAKQSIDNITGGKIAYFGCTPLDSTGKAIGPNGANNMYFKNEALKTNAWTEWEYYVSTTAKDEISVNVNGVKKVITPAVTAFPKNAVYFRPMFIVNYSGGNGIALVDGWILEDVTEQFGISELKHKASQIETNVNGINANVTTIKTYTDMSSNPITLVAKANYSAYDTPNEGEVYLHGLNDKRNPADVDGKCIWNAKTVSLPKVMFNPNEIVPIGIPIFMVRNISDNKWWSIWKETNGSTITWKRAFADVAKDKTVYTHTWNETNDIVVGYYIIKKTEPRDNEAPILIAQLFDGALNYKQATSMTLVGSISQLEILENELELKVQKNNVISSINLYTQENENGTSSGVKIQGDKIDLQGQVTFSSLADSNVAGSIKNIFTQQNNKTVINGGMIQTQSIKGNDLSLKGNLTVSKTVDNRVINTFAIKEDGDIEIDGLLKSANFSEALNTGYKISTDGTAIFNQAQIKGDVVLARAGMTNYGGPIGNENVIRNSNFTNALNFWSVHDMSSKTGTTKSVSVISAGDWCPPGIKILQIRGTNTTDRYGVISQSVSLTAGVKYTISGYCAGHRITKLQVNVRNTDASNANIHTVDYNPVIGGTSLSKWTYFTTSFTPTANARYALNLYATAMQSDGYAWFANIKLEAGETATPWCPHSLDQEGHVRIWAGSEYDKRDNAPFRVYQNGDIFATNGIFSGRVLGHIDSGNIHIDNGEFVINSTSTYMHDNEIVSINKGLRDARANPHIKFSVTENFINTDLTFGTSNDKRIFYNNNNRELTSSIAFVQNNSWGSIISNTDIVDQTTVKGFNILDTSNNNGGKHRIKYWKGYAGMIFESYGARQNDTINEQPYDFKFERLDGLVNVKVQGNIELTNSIQGSNQNIQLRSVANEGWGFFVI